ncbi:MAG: methionine synthase [Lachnospiraceae bacterium]|nr:methionine synthase [Lachnospiraceae bacterium]
MKEVKLTALNFEEGARYLGYKGNTPDDTVLKLMKWAENELINTSVPRYLYKKFPIIQGDGGIEVIGTSIVLTGNSVKLHLKNCNEVYLICGTLSASVDKLIRITELKDMASALILDAMAGVAIEQIMDKVENIIHMENTDKFLTYRFGIGYGDLPIELEPDFLKVLNAEKLIGLCSTESYTLSPRKSVICIMGVSDEEIIQRKRSCSVCNMQGRCEFRKRGDRCGF